MSGAEPTARERDAPARAARLGYIPALDGLRAVAVVAVLLYHDDVRRMSGGFLGVDVFFVISGYLITSLLLSDWRTTGRVRLRNFWFRRARRLLPALFLMLAVVCVYALLFLYDDVSQLRGQVLAAIGYVENWYLIFHHQSYFAAFGRPPLLQHVWSLAVEEQFYLAWPLLFSAGLAVWGHQRRRLLAAILGGALTSTILMAVLYTPHADPSRVYYGTDTHSAGLLMGAALALVWAPWRLSVSAGRRAPLALDAVGIGALVGLFWFFRNVDQFDPLLYRGGFAAVSLVTVVMIAVTVHPAARVVPRLLALPPFKWVGLRSYGIYLWHWPVYMVTRPHLDIELTGLPLLGLRIGITLVLAALSYHFVEQPIRHGALGQWVAALRQSTGERRRRIATGFALSGAGLGTFVAVIAIAVAAAGPAPRPPGFKSASIVLTPSTTTAPPTSATSTPVASDTAPPPPTLPPPPYPTAHVTAIGDSVMLGAHQSLVDAIGADKLSLNAAVSRQFPAAVAVLRAMRDAGQLGDEVVVHLGTNGTVSDGQFDNMMQVLSGVRRVVFVNAKVPRPWEGEVNDTLTAGVQRYPNAVLVDWHTIASQHPEFFARDGVHLEPSGARFYADLIAHAL